MQQGAALPQNLGWLPCAAWNDHLSTAQHETKLRQDAPLGTPFLKRDSMTTKTYHDPPILVPFPFPFAEEVKSKVVQFSRSPSGGTRPKQCYAYKA